MQTANDGAVAASKAYNAATRYLSESFGVKVPKGGTPKIRYRRLVRIIKRKTM